MLEILSSSNYLTNCIDLLAVVYILGMQTHDRDGHHLATKALGLASVFSITLGLLLGIGLLAPDQQDEKLALPNKVNPNTAPVAMLMQLPGMGPTKARALVAYRQQKGCVFRDLNDLMAVPGLGPVTLKRLADYLVFDPNGQHFTDDQDLVMIQSNGPMGHP